MLSFSFSFSWTSFPSQRFSNARSSLLIADEELPTEEAAPEWLASSIAEESSFAAGTGGEIGPDGTVRL